MECSSVELCTYNVHVVNYDPVTKLISTYENVDI